MTMAPWARNMLVSQLAEHRQFGFSKSDLFFRVCLWLLVKYHFSYKHGHKAWVHPSFSDSRIRMKPQRLGLSTVDLPGQGF
jgi:hypothetical protein